jgi:hypothetical protein
MEKYSNLIEKYKHFRDFPEYEKTREICLIAVKKNIYNIVFINKQSYKICKYTCNKNGSYIYYIGDKRNKLYEISIKNDYRTMLVLLYDQKFLKKDKFNFYLKLLNINKGINNTIKYKLPNKYLYFKKNLSYYIF